MSLPGRYWDSNMFLGWLNREHGKFDLCDAVIEAAKAGKCRIITSALTFAEVYWIKRGTKLSPEQQVEITDLFNYSWIIPVELDRLTAESARTIMWKHPRIQSWDAVHVASAIKARKLGQIECFDTFDGDLTGLTGKLDDTDLRLSLPDLPPMLPFVTASTAPEPPSEQSPGDGPAKGSAPERARPEAPQAAPGPPPPGSSPGAAQKPPSAG